jgi:hypothetical protein
MFGLEQLVPQVCYIGRHNRTKPGRGEDKMELYKGKRGEDEILTDTYKIGERCVCRSDNDADD